MALRVEAMRYTQLAELISPDGEPQQNVGAPRVVFFVSGEDLPAQKRDHR